MNWDDFERVLCWMVIKSAEQANTGSPWLARLSCLSYYGWRWHQT